MQLSWLEQLICNQQVVGSSPSIGSLGEILKRPTRTDCKSVGLYLRRFESCSPHKTLSSGSSSVGRASAFQAECRRFEPGLPLNESRCSSGVERFLGKEKVPSSTLGIGSISLEKFFYIISLIAVTRSLSLEYVISKHSQFKYQFINDFAATLFMFIKESSKK